MGCFKLTYNHYLTIEKPVCNSFHLGNVHVVVSDKKLAIDNNNDGIIDGYISNLVSANDYYSYGSLRTGRSFNSSDYRFSFNGKENDNETGTQDYGMRIYNPQIAKFLSVDPLHKDYPMLTSYQFASNTPIQAIDLDGAEAWVFTETDGVGHAFIVVPSGKDNKQLVVYSYGRYNGSSIPSMGGYGPVGPGILIRKEGESAKKFIKERLSLKEGNSTFVFEFPKADAKDIRAHYDGMFKHGKHLPNNSKAHKKYGDEARHVDAYRLIPTNRNNASNCVTKTTEALYKGHAMDEFTVLSKGHRFDGGAYQDLKNELDPKSLGALLWRMKEFDKKENPKSRNVLDVTKQFKKRYDVKTK